MGTHQAIRDPRPLLGGLALILVVVVGWLVFADPSSPGAAAGPAQATSPAEVVALPLPDLTGVASDPSRAIAPSPAGPTHADPSDSISVEVVVIDELERPLAGALVRTYGDTEAGEWLSDEAGRVALPFLVARPAPGEGLRDDRSERLRVSAEKAGYFHVDRTPRARARVFLKLHRAIPLTGHVTDTSDGTGIAGATLTFPHRECSDCEPETALTQATGGYAFDAVPAGRKLELSIEAEGYVGKRSSFQPPAEALEARHDAALSRGLPLQVRVIDLETGAPLPGATVRGVKGPFDVDEDGRIESDQLATLDDGRTKLTAWAEGYCQLALRPTAGTLVQFSEPGGPELAFPLLRSVTVEGRVVGLDGVGREAELYWDRRIGFDAKSVPELAAASLESLAEQFPKWSLSAERDANDELFKSSPDGTFELRGAPPWVELELSASTQAQEYGVERVTLPGPGTTHALVLRLAPGSAQVGTGSITGRVTLNGEVEKGTVHWEGPTRKGSARTDKRGHFALQGVELGAVELVARSDRLLARTTCTLDAIIPRTVVVEAGAELELDFELSLPMATISGRATSASGTPLADLSVEAEDPLRCWRERVRTDADGRYELEVPVALAEFKVEATRSPETLKVPTVFPGTAGVDFIFAEQGRLRFRALDESDGAVIKKGELNWRWPDSRYTRLASFDRLVPDPEGWYEVDCVAGTIDLSIATGRERHIPQTRKGISVYPGSVTEVEFSLRPSLTRRIQFTDQSMELPSDFELVMVPSHLAGKIRYLPEKSRWDGLGKNGPYGFVTFKRNGKAVARGLKPGNYSFVAWPETLDVEPGKVRLKSSQPDGTVRVTVRPR